MLYNKVMKLLSLGVTIAGLWLIVSPWILGYWKVSSALWSQVVAGVVIMLLSMWQLAGKE
ncbi:MAG: SPW repeat protein [Candidatus Harrisonbacteria bacterium]|nr:SPW repeat protein [Candidatus Harrisonbacteria bacterium]